TLKAATLKAATLKAATLKAATLKAATLKAATLRYLIPNINYNIIEIKMSTITYIIYSYIY
ncbi:MAG: hypothetical protein E6522_08380, partial [Streptococcus vestibularis]|nr:hypothetical protein [Streptococcus vestibularis]